MRYISLKDVQPYFSGWFHYQRHFNRNYRSGKTFSVRGYFYIDFDVLERWCRSDDVVDPGSDFYSRRQHVMIDALVLNSFAKDDGVIMTKAQEKRYVREYEEGKRQLTLQQYKLDEADKRRRADKRRVTMVKKQSEDAEDAQGENVQKNVRTALSGNGVQKPQKDSYSGIKDEFQREDEMKSEIPQDWNYYPREGQKTRSDGSRLHRKCLPSLWMKPVQYAAFCRGEIDEDDFENIWTGYTMAEAGHGLRD